MQFLFVCRIRQEQSVCWEHCLIPIEVFTFSSIAIKLLEVLSSWAEPEHAACAVCCRTLHCPGLGSSTLLKGAHVGRIFPHPAIQHLNKVLLRQTL